jgi:hypothetical protein
MRYMYEDLNGVGDVLKQVGGDALTIIKDKALSEVEARAHEGAKKAVQMPLMISLGASGLALILSFIALLRR